MNGTAPSIITTAPTDSLEVAPKKKSTFNLPRRHKAPEMLRLPSPKPSSQSLSDVNSGQISGGPTSANPSARESRITFDEPERILGLNAPPAYGDNSNSSLALPVSRLSESSRSEGSLGDHGVYATTTTTHTVSTTTTFFRLPRRKNKNKGPLFPLPVKVPPQNHLKTRALRHEHQSVPIHQSQHAISLLLDFHPSPQSIALSRITKAMHPLPLFPLRATQSVTRLKRILATLHLS